MVPARYGAVGFAGGACRTNALSAAAITGEGLGAARVNAGTAMGGAAGGNMTAKELLPVIAFAVVCAALLAAWITVLGWVVYRLALWL